MLTIPNTKKYNLHVQYVYHFQYPMNSIDVRKITVGEMLHCRAIIKFFEGPIEGEYFEYKDIGNVQNYETVKKMFKEHFPEELI